MKKTLVPFFVLALTLVGSAVSADDAATAEPNSAPAAVEIEVEAPAMLGAADAPGCNAKTGAIESLDFEPQAMATCTNGQKRWIPTSQCCCNGKKKELHQTCSGGRWVTTGSACIGLFCSPNCPV